MIATTPAGEQLATVASRAADTAPPRTGREIASVAETLYHRLFTLALGGLQLTCALSILAASVRTEHANFARTAALALGLTLLAALAMRDSERCYWSIRRCPALALTAPVLALAALVIDGVSHSPLSFTAAASIALPAFVCARRWALTAATIVSVGAVAAALLQIGSGALNSVGQGTAAYFIWAIVLAGLAESFALLAMRMPHDIFETTTSPLPQRVANLAGDPRPSPATERASQPAPQPQTKRAAPAAISLTARQLQVVALLADGLRADDIADELGIATSTVYKYVNAAKRRAGVSSRDELVALAIRMRLLPSTAEIVDNPRVAAPTRLATDSADA